MKNKFWITIWLLAGLGWGAAMPLLAEDAVHLKIATLDHPHVKAIRDGRVPVPECSVEFSTLSVESLRAEMTESPRYDVLEIEMLPYLRRKAVGGLKDYTLLPIFLMRDFNLRHMYVRSDRSIHSPADLRGKKIGVDGYAGTTPTWIRGIVQSSWSVHPDEMTWVDVSASSGPARSLSNLISKGQVDAVISLQSPEDFGGNKATIIRLFPDYKAAENAIFQDTRIFPIQTALAVRKDLVEKNAWLPEALFLAFSEAKEKAYDDHTMRQPWEGVEEVETIKMMGANYWSYGVKSNPKTLGALFRYAHEQKLLPESMKPDEEFEPSTVLLMEPVMSKQ
jgi:4,5-dihydroxyphthalate decarboxylase